MTHCGCNTTPCGCRSSGLAIAPGGAHGGRACACGGRGCATCEPRAFIRPRFFAGQLLTDEDLALLGDYVVGKNRLHNRALWGPGVVCGLDVDCDPCGDGHVVVQPGYAITCCGDDIVVPCPEPVDILALIRDLTRSSLGAECADPCEQPRYQRAVPPAPPANTPGAILAGRLPDPKAPVRRYYLYVRYAEALTDPVSPYATDEPCAGQACEPTRVREGHTYELPVRERQPALPGARGSRDRVCREPRAGEGGRGGRDGPQPGGSAAGQRPARAGRDARARVRGGRRGGARDGVGRPARRAGRDGADAGHRRAAGGRSRSDPGSGRRSRRCAWPPACSRAWWRRRSRSARRSTPP